MGSATDQGAVDETRAFVAARLGSQSWVVELPKGRSTVGSGTGAGVRLEASEIPDTVGTFGWDGERLTLSVSEAEPATFLNGKRFDHEVDLKPGDELSIGGAQLVVGMTMPVTPSGRRALTHNEFRERLYEEMARAGRGGRPTSLIMVQARTGEGARITATALASFRAGDVLGTYAHDELEMLLPDSAGEIARSVVERLISASGAVGAVAGLAVAPEHGDNPERLLRAARRALARARESEKGIETPPPRMPSDSTPDVHDPASSALVDELRALARKDGPVMLVGELSSGKAIFARVLHDASDRKSSPFIVMQCASLADEDLDEAFGGDGDSPARRARGGTLLLDEVGDLSAEGQHRLVTMLGRDGGDVRVIATTHRTLAGLVERGAFDEKLFQRLTGEVVEVPPLRQRPEDIIPLAERFAGEGGAKAPVRMSPGALARLRSYPWPGNVLELRNAMERAVRLAGTGEILAEHLPSDVPIGTGEGRLREHVDSVERDAIVKALADANHNQTHAARRLGISRRALIYKMEKYGLKPPPGTARRG